MNEEKYSEKREQRKLQRQAQRAERIEKAELHLKEETRKDIVQQAKHVLIEEELAERIDETDESLFMMKQEFRDIRKEHIDIVRKIRKDLGVRRPVSEKERAMRREKAKQHQEYIDKTLELIREIEEKCREKNDEELFEILPPREAIMVSRLSYTELANLLNERKYLTFYGKEWTRISVQKIIERYGRKLQGIGYKQDALKTANKKRKADVLAFAKKMRDEVFITIDDDLPHLTIAKELNARGIKTRTDGEWGNVAVSRLFQSFKKLKE